ncbi:unnamed protein product [Lampetra planeri]
MWLRGDAFTWVQRSPIQRRATAATCGALVARSFSGRSTSRLPSSRHETCGSATLGDTVGAAGACLSMMDVRAAAPAHGRVTCSVAERAQRQRFASHLAHASGLSPAGPNFPSGATENRHGLVTEAQCVMVSCDSGQQEGPTAAPCSATAPQQQQQHGLLLSRAAHKRRQAESVAPAPSRERRGTLGGARIDCDLPSHGEEQEIKRSRSSQHRRRRTSRPTIIAGQPRSDVRRVRQRPEPSGVTCLPWAPGKTARLGGHLLEEACLWRGTRSSAKTTRCSHYAAA